MGYCILVLKCKYALCFDFQDLGGRRSYNVGDFYDFFFLGGGRGLKIMGACGWLFRDHVI